MARKLKTTPFARFLVAMLFIVPLAYIGASYYNGEDPIENIKDKLGIEENQQVQAEDTAGADTVSDEANYDLRQEINELRDRIRELEEENERLKEKVHELQMRE